MQASDVNKYLKDTANDPESLWLIVASVVFFPLVLAWAVWKLFNKGADAFLAQALYNTKLKHFQDARIETLKEAHKQQMMFEYQQYLAEREKRLQAYEKKIRAQAPPPETTAPALDAPAQWCGWRCSWAFDATPPLVGRCFVHWH